MIFNGTASHFLALLMYSSVFRDYQSLTSLKTLITSDTFGIGNQSSAGQYSIQLNSRGTSIIRLSCRSLYAAQGLLSMIHLNYNGT